jgi:hypothetical protein
MSPKSSILATDGENGTTENSRGRASPWNKEQQVIIRASLPSWVQFSLVENKDVDGRDPKLTQWKKEEANRILSLPAFANLPHGVSVLEVHHDS